MEFRSTRGALFYLLRNRFYIGEVNYKGQILPASSPRSSIATCSISPDEAHGPAESPDQNPDLLRPSPDRSDV